MAKHKKTKGNSPSFFLGGIGCLILAWLAVFLLYALWGGIDEPGKGTSLLAGLTWQSPDTSLPGFRIGFYVLGAVTQAFVAGLLLMAVGNSLPRAFVTFKISLALLVILVVPFLQLYFRLGLVPLKSFPGILLADAVLSIFFLLGFVSFLSIRRSFRKHKEAEEAKKEN